jgi:hypothetical protein
MTIFANKLQNLIEKLEELPILAEIVADEVMAKEFPDKVRNQIKEEGENDQGQLIQEGYSNYWGIIRSVAGLQIEYVDLYYTGKFLDGLTTVESGDEYTLDSDVGYFQDLKDRYSGIMGLQEDNLALIIEEIRIKLIKELRDGR